MLVLPITSVPLNLIPLSGPRGMRASQLISGRTSAFPRLTVGPPAPLPSTHPRQGLLLVQGGLSFDGGVPGTVGEKGTA